jgi:phage shock protein PspC (stress-responsive transcriptional regulator)
VRGIAKRFGIDPSTVQKLASVKPALSRSPQAQASREAI